MTPIQIFEILVRLYAISRDCSGSQSKVADTEFIPYPSINIDVGDLDVQSAIGHKLADNSRLN